MSTAILSDPRLFAILFRIDSELAERMARKSLQRAAFFDWRETARKTMAVYEEVAGIHRAPLRSKELVSR